MFSRKTRFSVLQLMAATVVIAVFSVALFNDNEWWRATLGTVTTAMILNALLAAIFTKGERWAFSLSYFVGAVFFACGAYTYVASLPFLLTIKAYEFVKAYASSPPNQENFMIVAVIFWIQITCYGSGIVGRACIERHLPRRRNRQKQRTRVRNGRTRLCRASLPSPFSTNCTWRLTSIDGVFGFEASSSGLRRSHWVRSRWFVKSG